MHGAAVAETAMSEPEPAGQGGATDPAFDLTTRPKLARCFPAMRIEQCGATPAQWFGVPSATPVQDSRNLDASAERDARILA
jgi:hypothetical protein